MQVRIVGLGTMKEGELCEFTGQIATGYVDTGDNDMTPCKINLLGEGQIGEMVDVPTDWEGTLTELKSLDNQNYN